MRSARVQPAFACRTSSSASSITACGDHACDDGCLLAGLEHGVRDLGQPAVDVGADLRVDPVQHLLAGLAGVRLRPPRHQRGLLGEPVELQPVRRPPVPGLERLDQLGRLRGDLTAPGRDQVHRLLRDADDLARLAVRAHREQHPERVGEPLLHRALADRRGGALQLVQRAGVDRAPHAVIAQDAVEEGVVDVQVRVVLAGVVLEERRDDPLRGRRSSGPPLPRGARSASTRRSR